MRRASQGAVKRELRRRRRVVPGRTTRPAPRRRSPARRHAGRGPPVRVPRRRVITGRLIDRPASPRHDSPPGARLGCGRGATSAPTRRNLARVHARRIRPDTGPTDRRRLAAAGLSAILPGLGQAFNGRRRLALWFLIPSLILIAIGVDRLQDPVPDPPCGLGRGPGDPRHAPHPQPRAARVAARRGRPGLPRYAPSRARRGASGVDRDRRARPARDRPARRGLAVRDHRRRDLRPRLRRTGPQRDR